MAAVIINGKQHWLQLYQHILQIDEADIKSQQIEIQSLIEKIIRNYSQYRNRKSHVST